MTEREVLKLALEALEVNLGTWSAKKKAIAAIKEVLAQPEPSDLDVWKSRALQAEAVIEKFMAQPEREPVAWETFALKFANGKGLSYEKPKNLPKYLACRPLIYAPVSTSDTSEKRVDEMAKQRHEPEPVIDKSAAIRIATSLGWEPKRKPLTDEEIWLLTSEYNDYDQHGEYFEAVFIGKPTSKQIQKHCHVTEQGAVHILNGGGRVKYGRVKYEYKWYNLRKEKAAHGIKD